MNKIIAANHKMNLCAKDITSYVKQIDSLCNDEIIIFPSSIFVPYFLKKSFNVGVQNIYCRPNGAFTGEISAEQVKSLGIKYALIGHSERRLNNGEDDFLINLKIKSAINSGLTPILCVGETKEQKDLHKTDKVIKKQLTRALQDLNVLETENLIIAYEPIWAIGSGDVATNLDIKAMVSFIKGEIYKQKNAKPKVLYGGSVNPANIKELLEINEVDGFLIGGASLRAEDFKSIINKIKEA